MREAHVHVVLLTAITLEYQEAKKVDAGALEGTQWEEEQGPNGLPVAFRTFRGKGGLPLRVAVAQAGGMGGVATANTLNPLVEKYQPQCVAMSGVCAGHPHKTNLGDVIAADRLFFHDMGKREPDGVKHDLQTYNLRDDWKVRLEHFDFKACLQHEKWWKDRPVPYEWQKNWVLAMLHQGIAAPAAHPECNVYCPQWERVIKALWADGEVEHGTLALTAKGKERIGPVLIEHRNRFPDLSPGEKVLPFKVHVAPMGSGNQVVEDEKIWSEISESMRKTLGLDMEVAAIGAAAHALRDKKLEFLVMKGVMDFANQGRDDQFKEFAARASAECLIAFLRDQLHLEPIPGVDDILVSGTEPLRENPPPSALLNARYEVVSFHKEGREAILAELDRWCDEGPPIAVRLVHAEGGVGKTRLAIEWMGWRPQGWKFGFLPRGAKDDWFERLWGLGQQVVVVLDYAESRSDLEAMLLRMHRYAQQKGAWTHRRFRLLMLARNAGDWWQLLRHSDAALGTWLDATPPCELPALATEVAEREKVFNEAAEWFAKKRGTTYQRRNSLSLTDGRFGRVLYLHMAALAAVEGLAFDASTLMDAVLDHEEHFWETQAQQGTVRRTLQTNKARQVVAAATLRGGIETRDAATRTAVRIFGRTTLSESEEELLEVLHRIYQRTDAKDSTALVFLPTLEPDLLGEGMVARVANPRLKGDRLPPEWIDRVFPLTEEPDVVRTGFEVLGRASASSPGVLRPWIERLLTPNGAVHKRGRLALEAAKSVGLHTAFSVLGDVLAEQLEEQGDAHVARELEAAGIPDSTVSLGKVATWVSRVQLDGVTPEETSPETGWFRKAARWVGGVLGLPPVAMLEARARHLSNLGVRLSGLGRREEALTASQKATELYRVLARRQPDVFHPGLAMSLSNLGAMLVALGRREEALKAAQESVELRRILARRQPDAFRPDLATSLNNLGAMLSDELGRHEEALKAAQESVELRRALAQSNPDAFQRDLASSLNNLSTILVSLGRREEALKAAQEAMELYRALARRQPDAFQPNLAMSLINLSAMLRELGKREEALPASQEAAELFRTLARRQPDAFQPYLAMGLNNLGAMLSEVGRREEALKAAQEAVELRRDQTQRQPDAFQPDLAMSLNNLGSMLNKLGRREEALKATQEAVELYLSLAQRRPEAVYPYLAASLNNLGALLNEVGRHEEALTATQGAVVVYGALVQSNPDAFQPKLAMSFNNLSQILSNLGRHEEALKAARESVELRRALVQSNPDAFQPDLASSLNSLGVMLSELGRREEALTASQEAVELYWALVQNNPDAFQPDLASSLNNLGSTLSALGRREEALTASQEAVELYRALAQSYPDAFQPILAMRLQNLGAILSDLGRHEEALKATQEAAELERALGQRPLKVR